MKTLNFEQQMTVFLTCLRGRSAVRDAKPAEPESVLMAALAVAAVAPEHGEMAAWEAKHGFPVTSVDDYNKMVALVAADIAGAPRSGETQH